MNTIRKIFFIVAILASSQVWSQPGLDYYLPDGLRFNPAIPTPESVIGYQVGEYHLTYDKLLRYLEVLDQASDRITLVTIGQSHEKQPLIQLIITSPANHQNLDKIRKDHLDAIDPENSGNPGRKEPLIVWLGYSVHGNEPSGANAAPVVAYYLAASENEQVTGMLEQTVILLDPCLNPDGLNRFAYFINSRKSKNNNPDLNSFEFQELWPGARTNHYWFDLNRDWLLLQHPETQALVEQFHKWKPNLVTDHHEMGSNSTFFFQPGVPSRTNPIIPAGNFALTQRIGTYHAASLDQIGSLYYTEESFDDFYFGKGSTYPDIHGSIGILFEQAGSRGHLRQTSNGLLSFPFTIRNQVRVSLSSLEAAHNLRRELQYYMADFYKSALVEGETSAVKGYLFGDPADPVRTQMMADLLLKHQIQIQSLDRAIEVNGTHFEPLKSYFVPSSQAQFRLIRTLFETVTSFVDSTFYDVSTWTLPLAMGIPYEPVDVKNVVRIAGKTVIAGPVPVVGTITGTESTIGYLITPDSYYLHKAIYQLLNEGILLKIAQEPFSLEIAKKRVRFNPGTILIPSQSQPLASSDLYFTLTRLAGENGLTIYPAPTGYSPEGPDLGSGRFSNLALPKVLTLTGSGSSGITGEIWHLFDTRFDIPLTMAEARRFSSINLDQYNTLILTGGTYPELEEAQMDKLKEWVRRGGNLIGIEAACGFLGRNGLARLELVESPASEKKNPAATRPYAKRGEDNTGKSIPGSIFLASLDTTHPLGYGYHRDKIAIFRENTIFYKPSPDLYENPAIFTGDPLLSGYINRSNLEKLKNSSAIQRQSYGNGKVILFMDDPLFRGYWTGMHKIFLNAVFWGKNQ